MKKSSFILIFTGILASASLSAQDNNVVVPEGFEGKSDNFSPEDKDVTKYELKDLQGLRVLVVEDQDLVRVGVKQILESEGAIVSTATNDKEAITLVSDEKNGRYGLILMDNDLGFSQKGPEIAKEIRAGNFLSSDAIIISISGRQTEGLNKQCVEAGMNGSLDKSSVPEKLLINLNRWIRLGRVKLEDLKPETETPLNSPAPGYTTTAPTNDKTTGPIIMAIMPTSDTKDNAETLISTALNETYIEKARNDLSQAKVIISNLSKKEKTDLTSKYETAEKEIQERPKKTLVEAIKTKFDIGYMSDDDVIIYALDHVIRDLEGKITNNETAKMTFGTLANNLEDGMLYQAFVMKNTTTNMNARKRALPYVNTVRLLILCSNNNITLENGEKMSIVDFFLQDSMLDFTNYFMGIKSPTIYGEALSPITAADFNTSTLLIPDALKNRGMERFKLISDGLMLKK